MGAGVPNYQRLAEMGKLPKEAYSKLPHFAGLDETRKELNRLREGMCPSCLKKLYPKEHPEVEETAQIRCDVPGCRAMVGGKSEGEARAKLEEHKSTAHPVPVPPKQTPPQQTQQTSEKKDDENKNPSGQTTQPPAAGKPA